MNEQYRSRAVWAAVMGVVLCGVLLAGISCSRKSQDDANGISVFVSIPPQKDFVQRIGGDKVSVELLIKPGADPHTFEPTTKQMVRLSRAKLYFQIDMPFENRLLGKIRSMAPEMVIVDTGSGIKKRAMGGCTAHDHDGHEHEGSDPHIWLDPMLVKIQGRHICDALKNADPANADYYEANLQKFLADLDKLNTDIAAKLAQVKGGTFFVFHPAFGYFADAYGLHQQSVEVDGKTPTARQLQQLISNAGEHGAKVIFVEPQFSTATAETVARQIFARVETLDPLSEDYFANMRTIADKIFNALK